MRQSPHEWRQMVRGGDEGCVPPVSLLPVFRVPQVRLLPFLRVPLVSLLPVFRAQRAYRQTMSRSAVSPFNFDQAGRSPPHSCAPIRSIISEFFSVVAAPVGTGCKQASGTHIR